MANNFYSKVNLMGHIQSGMGNFGQMQAMPSMSSGNIGSMDETQPSSFKGVMSGLTQNLNSNINAPDQLLKDAMTGNNNVDIHDVMTAMAKAEISVNIATQATTKVIQAYDKIMQISV